MRKSTSRGQLSTGHVPLGLELLGQEGVPDFWVVKRQGETERGKEKKEEKEKKKKDCVLLSEISSFSSALD